MREDVIYGRAVKFAKAAKVVAIAVVVAGLCEFCYHAFFRVSIIESRFVAEFLPVLWQAFSALVTKWLRSALVIVAAGALVFLSARAVVAKCRPSWAPVITERFADQADKLALILLGFSGVYLIVAIVQAANDIASISARALPGSSTVSFAMITIGDIIGATSAAFAMAGGALIIQALVIVATKDYAAPCNSDKERPDGRA